MQKDTNIDYVDLGLPSGTKWATMNIGAEKETDYGLYFAWGETQGYSGITEDKKFSWNDYKYGISTSVWTKYNSTDGLTTLEPSDDAATVNWGGKWKMPTIEQVNELLDASNCTNQFVIDYKGTGINGRLITSVRNGTKLFFPAGGCLELGVNNYIGKTGDYWTSGLRPGSKDFAQYLTFSNESMFLHYYYRYCGRMVRPVFV